MLGLIYLMGVLGIIILPIIIYSDSKKRMGKPSWGWVVGSFFIYFFGLGTFGKDLAPDGRAVSAAYKLGELMALWVFPFGTYRFFTKKAIKNFEENTQDKPLNSESSTYMVECVNCGKKMERGSSEIKLCDIGLVCRECYAEREGLTTEEIEKQAVEEAKKLQEVEEAKLIREKVLKDEQIKKADKPLNSESSTYMVECVNCGKKMERGPSEIKLCDIGLVCRECYAEREGLTIEEIEKQEVEKAKKLQEVEEFKLIREKAFEAMKKVGVEKQPSHKEATNWRDYNELATHLNGYFMVDAHFRFYYNTKNKDSCR